MDSLWVLVWPKKAQGTWKLRGALDRCLFLSLVWSAVLCLEGAPSSDNKPTGVDLFCISKLHVTDRFALRPVATGVAVLRAARDVAGDDFVWRPPPYEYEEVKPVIDILWGSQQLRTAIDAGASPDEILATAPGEIAAFESLVADCLLYD